MDYTSNIDMDVKSSSLFSEINISLIDIDDLPLPSSEDFLPEEFSNGIKIILAIFYSAICSGALLGNGCVILIMILNPSLRTVTNTFIISLVVSDSFIAAFNVPLQLLFHLKNEWTLGEGMCKVTSFVQGVSILTSILALSAISIERYHVICHPIKARYIRSTRTAFLMLLSIWCLAILLMLPHVWIQRLQQRLAWQHDEYPPIRIAYLCVEYFPKFVYNILYTYGFLFIFYIVPIAIMVYAYGKMIHVLWARPALMDDPILSTQVSDKREIQKRNIVRMLITIVVLFTSCWLPFFTMHVVMLHHDITYCIRVLQAFALLIGYSNSCLNPFVYFFLNSKFKRVFRKTLSRCRCVKGAQIIEPKKRISQTTIA